MDTKQPEHEHKIMYNEKARTEFFRLAGHNNVVLNDSKRAVVNTFFDTENHMTAKELLELTAAGCVSCTIEIVEETLRLLEEYGFAKRQEFENLEGDVLYEHRHLTEHHDHIVCIKCGRIIEFFDPMLESLQEKISRSYGFETLNHKLEIYGICSECLGRREALMPVSMAAQGERVVIKKVRGGQNLVKKLSDMGLTPGTKAEVVTSGGQMIISVRGSRVALGRGMASKVLVSLDRNQG